MHDRVSIGLPTYNRPDLLRAAVVSLQEQTHQNIEILISDNASPDPRVMATIKELAERDRRIKYICREKNEGAEANFRGVLAAADAPFFMWASDDDLWEKNFVERCLALLEAHPEAQMAFGGIDNVNLDGAVLRTYPGFSRFTSSTDRRSDVLRFIAEPDILGKANLIYGLYRTASIKAVADACWDRAGFMSFGGDVVLIFAFISRYPIVATDEVLLHKRIATSSNAPLRVRDPRTYFVPPWHIASFVRRHKAVAPDPNIMAAVTRAFGRRLMKQSITAAGDREFWQAVGQRSRAHLFRLFGRH